MTQQLMVDSCYCKVLFIFLFFFWCYCSQLSSSSSSSTQQQPQQHRMQIDGRARVLLGVIRYIFDGICTKRFNGSKITSSYSRYFSSHFYTFNFTYIHNIFFSSLIFISYFIYRISHVCTVYTIDYALSICMFFVFSVCDIPLILEVTFTLLFFFFSIRCYYSINALRIRFVANIPKDTSYICMCVCLYCYHKVLHAIRVLFLLLFVDRFLCILTGRQLFCKLFFFSFSLSVVDKAMHCPAKFSILKIIHSKWDTIIILVLLTNTIESSTS